MTTGWSNSMSCSKGNPFNHKLALLANFRTKFFRGLQMLFFHSVYVEVISHGSLVGQVTHLTIILPFSVKFCRTFVSEILHKRSL